MDKSTATASSACNLLKLAARATNDAIWDLDLSTGTITWGEGAEALFGITGSDRNTDISWWLAKVEAEDRARIALAFQTALSGPDETWIGEYRFERADGKHIPVIDRAFIIRDAAGNAQRVVGAMMDCSELSSAREAVSRARADLLSVVETSSIALLESEERLNLALQAGGIIAWECDLTTGLVKRSSTARQLLGLADDATGALLDNVHPDDRHVAKKLRSGTEGLQRFRYHHPNGSLMWLEGRSEIVTTGARPPRAVGFIADVTLKVSTEQKLWRLAHHDYLTGLPNRMYLQRHLEQLIEEQTPFHLLIVDLDHFKDINDAVGHDAGDAVLCEVRRRLKNGLSDDDFVARLGGDEFAVVTFRPRQAVAKAILTCLTAQIVWKEHQFSALGSVGGATFPRHGAAPSDLLKSADLALYKAESLGRGRFATFDASLKAAAQARLTLSAEVRRALNGDEFLCHYQLQVCSKTGGVIGLEALARWLHPTKGLLTPAAFGDAFDAPEVGLALGRKLRRKVMNDVAAWMQNGIHFGRIAVNISAPEFANPKLVDEILAQATAAGLSPSNFTIEITEGVLLGCKSDHCRKSLGRLRDAGFRVALDDFGTGYASLQHLRSFKIDEIKIDKQFVQGIRVNEGDAAIVSAILGLCRSLKIPVVAEGVECQGEVDFLLHEKCEVLQGYYYSRPLGFEQTTLLLQNWRATPPRRSHLALVS